MFTGLVQQMGTVEQVVPGETTRVVIRPDRAWGTVRTRGEHRHQRRVSDRGRFRRRLVRRGRHGPDAGSEQRAGPRPTGQSGARARGSATGSAGTWSKATWTASQSDSSPQRRRVEVIGFDLPVPLHKYVVAQGSICLDGVSLTVSAKTDSGASRA